MEDCEGDKNRAKYLQNKVVQKLKVSKNANTKFFS